MTDWLWIISYFIAGAGVAACLVAIAYLVHMNIRGKK